MECGVIKDVIKNYKESNFYLDCKNRETEVKIMSHYLETEMKIIVLYLS